MTKPSPPKVHRQAIDIIERMQKIGFPTTNDIADLEALLQQLKKLSLSFKDAAHRISIKEIAIIIQAIKERLKVDNDIPTEMYVTLNDRLIVLKDDLMIF